MRALTKLVILALVSTLAACSSGSDKDKAGDKSGVTEADKARWPEEGDYNVSLTVNGCKVAYEAKSRAEYCVKLQDESLDTCGIRDSRERYFRSDCGGEFEPRSIKPVQIYGYDDYLQRQCEVSTDQRFARKSDLCGYYADESIHQGCFWQARRREFTSLKCSGSFSTQPAKVEPTPRPTPSDTTPVPTPAPQRESNLARTVSAFAKIGIEVDVAQNHGYPMPGEPRFEEQVDSVSKVMLGMFNDFKRRKGSMPKLTIATYTTYTPQHLYLGADLSQAEIARYLAAHDARIELQKKSGIEFDFGIEVYGHERGDKLAFYSGALSFFSQMQTGGSLPAISDLIKKIEVDSTNYLSFFSSSIEFKREEYQAQFSANLPLLKQLSAAAKLGVTYDSYLNLAEPHVGLEKVARYILQHKSEIEFLRAMKKPIKVEVNPSYDGEASFWVSLGELHLPAKASFDGEKGMDAFLKLMPVMRDLFIEFEIGDNKLDTDFAIQSQAVAKRKSALLAKVRSGALDKIFFGASTTSGSYATLYVGNDAEKTLDQVLAKMKK